MKAIGVLAVQEDKDGNQSYAVINPEHPYMVMTPEETPDDMLLVVSAIIKQGVWTPVGILVDPGVELGVQDDSK